MDLSQIKKFIPKEGERYIFIEDGKPIGVLLSFLDYQKNFKTKEKEKISSLVKKEEKLEKKEFSENGSLKKESPKKELRVEDLPF